MAATQEFNPGKKSEQRPDPKDAVKDAVRDTINQAKEQANQGWERGVEISAAVQESVSKAAQLTSDASELNGRLLTQGIQAALLSAKDSTEMWSQRLGFTGADAEHLVHQCQTNVEAVGRCTTVIAASLHDVTRSWFEFGEKQWRRNLDAVQKLARTNSVQEFTAVHSEFIRESLQHLTEDTRSFSEKSLRTAAEANKIITRVAENARVEVADVRANRSVG